MSPPRTSASAGRVSRLIRASPLGHLRVRPGNTRRRPRGAPVRILSALLLRRVARWTRIVPAAFVSLDAVLIGRVERSARRRRRRARDARAGRGLLRDRPVEVALVL